LDHENRREACNRGSATDGLIKASGVFSLLLPGIHMKKNLGHKKICGKCKKIKSLDDFYRMRKTYDGRHTVCKVCCKMTTDRWKIEHREQVRAIKRSWEKKNAFRIASRKRERRFGLAPGEYSKMLQIQNERCAICNGSMNPVHLDHDPITGKIRGLLCPRCNHGLGKFHDNPTMLSAAISYIEKYRK
jgi:hypothetical protein